MPPSFVSSHNQPDGTPKPPDAPAEHPHVAPSVSRVIRDPFDVAAELILKPPSSSYARRVEEKLQQLIGGNHEMLMYDLPASPGPGHARFDLIRPGSGPKGGNDTLLIQFHPHDSYSREEIMSMARYFVGKQLAEQTGIFSTDVAADAQVRMADEELCIGSIISAALRTLLNSGRSTPVQHILASGTETQKPVECFCKDYAENEFTVEVGLRMRPKFIKLDAQGNTLVDFEGGIAHILSPIPEQEALNEECNRRLLTVKDKRDYMELFKRYSHHLVHHSAVGVIFYNWLKGKGGPMINPIVGVGCDARKGTVDMVVKEGACGSGSIALALERGPHHDEKFATGMQVWQPSGSPFTIKMKELQRKKPTFDVTLESHVQFLASWVSEIRSLLDHIKKEAHT